MEDSLYHNGGAQPSGEEAEAAHTTVAGLDDASGVEAEAAHITVAGLDDASGVEDRVLVIGGGTMGAGIATAFLAADAQVILLETSPDLLEAGRSRIEDSLSRMARRDASLDITATLGRLDARLEHPENEIGLVIEAVPENLELKQQIFTDLANRYDDVVLASNTSSLSITDIAANVPSPERVVGMHFFNPVPVSSLVEVVVGERTSPESVTLATSWTGRLGKTPIVVNDSPGFASSRLGIALGMEAIRMVEDGVASAADIDAAMELGYKHPMGPLRLTDLVGLDVRLAIAEHLAGELGPRFEPPQLLRDLVDQGHLGKKTGRGFHDWS